MQVIDTSLQLCNASRSRVTSDKAPLTAHDFQDTELLAAYFANVYDLSEEDCSTFVKEIKAQLAPMRAEFKRAGRTINGETAQLRTGLEKLSLKASMSFILEALFGVGTSWKSELMKTLEDV